MSTRDPDPPPARRPRRFGRRRVPLFDDSVDMRTDASHAWWAQRDELETTIQRRGTTTGSVVPPGAGTAPMADQRFGPATSGAQFAPPTTEVWDASSVYTWAATAEPSPQDDPPATPLPQYHDGPTTPWDVLGISVDASWLEVSRRHKQLAKSFHPDRHGLASPDLRRDAELKMSEINAAFTELGRIYTMMDET